MKQKIMNKTIKLLMLFMVVCVSSNIYAATNPHTQWQTIDGVKTITCVYHTWEQVYKNTGVELPNWGNAKYWYNKAKDYGYAVGDTPKAKSVFVSFDGQYGHVGWIEKKTANGWYTKEGGISTIDKKPYNGNGIKEGNRDFKDTTYKFIYVTEPVKHTHKFGKWLNITAGSCEKDGKQKRKCGCGEEETKIIKATGHEYSEGWTIDKVATCESNGAKFHKCNKCGMKKDVTTINALGHAYSDNWKIEKAATCEYEGIEYRICSRCNKKETKAISRLEHKLGEVVIDKEPTCINQGEKSKYCTICKSREDITKIDPLGHQYGEWEITKKATDFEEGSKERICSQCQNKEVVSIQKTKIILIVVSFAIIIIFVTLYIKQKRRGDY